MEYILGNDTHAQAWKGLVFANGHYAALRSSGKTFAKFSSSKVTCPKSRVSNCTTAKSNKCSIHNASEISQLAGWVSLLRNRYALVMLEASKIMSTHSVYLCTSQSASSKVERVEQLEHKL